jgi:hypothetical protein
MRSTNDKVARLHARKAVCRRCSLATALAGVLLASCSRRDAADQPRWRDPSNETGSASVQAPVPALAASLSRPADDAVLPGKDGKPFRPGLRSDTSPGEHGTHDSGEEDAPDVPAAMALQFDATPAEKKAGIDPNNPDTWPEGYHGPGIERALREGGGLAPADDAGKAAPPREED